MKEREFFKYHNVPIVFEMHGEEHFGVVFQAPGSRRYKYVSALNMIAWNRADKEKARELERDIDLEDIIWADEL